MRRKPRALRRSPNFNSLYREHAYNVIFCALESSKYQAPAVGMLRRCSISCVAASEAPGLPRCFNLSNPEHNLNPHLIHTLELLNRKRPFSLNTGAARKVLQLPSINVEVPARKDQNFLSQASWRHKVPAFNSLQRVVAT